jgi:hypothetical protein
MVEKTHAALEQARTDAHLLLKDLLGADEHRVLAAAERFASGLPYYRHLSPVDVLSLRDAIRNRQALIVVARELGEEDWDGLRRKAERLQASGIYYVEEGWGHIDNLGFEHVFRFVWDRLRERVTHMQVMRASQWRDCPAEAVADVAESLEHNEYPEDVERVARGEEGMFTSKEGFTNDLPEWATHKPHV